MDDIEFPFELKTNDEFDELWKLFLQEDLGEKQVNFCGSVLKYKENFQKAMEKFKKR